MPYALLQSSLDQVIPREALAEAFNASHDLTSYDSFLLGNELFGIVAKDLEKDAAFAIQQVLARNNYPTELIDQSELPELPEAMRGYSLRFDPDAVILIDPYEREDRRPWNDVVFVAAGQVLHLVEQPYQNLEWDITPGPRGSIHRTVKNVTEHRLANQPEFRVELFFDNGTRRVQCVLTDKNVLKLNGEMVRLRETDKLDALLQFLATAIPESRTNLGIKRSQTQQPLTYPSVRAFEEELVWSFYQLKRGAQPR
jgi:hypothetical protein